MELKTILEGGHLNQPQLNLRVDFSKEFVD